MKDFETRKEITSPKNKRIETFTFKGKNVFENKNEIQKEALNMSKSYIIDELKRLNINDNIINDFESDRITYDIPMDLFAPALYSGNSDFVIMNKTKEINFGTIIHEMLHAYSSQYRIKDINEVLDFSNKEKKLVKSGFHVNWYKNGFDKEASSINFSQINEAVTEKLARELVNQNYDKIVEFSNLNNDYIKKQRECHLKKIYIDEVEIKKNLELEIEEIHNKWNKKRKEYEIETKNFLEDIRNNFVDGEITVEKLEEYLNTVIEIRNSYIETMDSFEKSEINMTKVFSKSTNLEIESVKLDYSIKKDRDSYQNYINILNYLIEGVALNNSKFLEEVENKKIEIWDNLKRAYFSGNTMFLRIFDKTYDDNILRKFNKMGGISTTAYSNLMAEIEEKNNEFKEKLVN